MIINIEKGLHLTITNWRLLSSLHMKSPRIIDEHSTKKINPRNSHKNQKHLAIKLTTLIIIPIGSVIFPYKLPTSVIMKID